MYAFVCACVWLPFGSSLTTLWLQNLSSESEHILIAVDYINAASMGGRLRRLLPFLIGLHLITPQLEVIHLPDKDFAEFFAGDQAVTDGLRLLGFKGDPVDVRINSFHNLLTPTGFFIALTIIMRVRKGGVCWFAPPCSSWVWMSRASTGRAESRPLGNDDRANVRIQNILVSRVTYLLHLCWARGAHFLIEQPASSVMFLHPVLNKFIQKLGSAWHSVTLHMGCYSLEMPKETILCGWAPWLYKLERRMTPTERYYMNRTKTKDTATHWVDKGTGKKRTRGGKDLKSSQSYPMSFGCAHALAYDEFKSKEVRISSDDDSWPGLIDLSGDDNSDGEGEECFADIYENKPELFVGKAALAKETDVALR